MSRRNYQTHSNGSTYAYEYFQTVNEIQRRARKLTEENFIVLRSECNGLWSGYSAFKKNADGTEISYTLEFFKYLPKWAGESFCGLYGCSGVAIYAYLFISRDGKNSVIRYCQSCMASSKTLKDALERDEDFREISLEEADMIDVMES
jgi:hypothetical protein